MVSCGFVHSFQIERVPPTVRSLGITVGDGSTSRPRGLGLEVEDRAGEAKMLMRLRPAQPQGALPASALPDHKEVRRPAMKKKEGRAARSGRLICRSRNSDFRAVRALRVRNRVRKMRNQDESPTATGGSGGPNSSRTLSDAQRPTALDGHLAALFEGR